MPSVGGFVVPVPVDRLPEHEELARTTGAIFREHGALGVVERVGDDVPVGDLTSSTRAVQLTEGETVVFSWLLYESRKHRDAVNAKVMSDPWLAGTMEAMPLDGKRMIFGGFRTLLEM